MRDTSKLLLFPRLQLFPHPIPVLRIALPKGIGLESQSLFVSFVTDFVCCGLCVRAAYSLWTELVPLFIQHLQTRWTRCPHLPWSNLLSLWLSLSLHWLIHKSTVTNCNPNRQTTKCINCSWWVHTVNALYLGLEVHYRGECNVHSMW